MIRAGYLLMFVQHGYGYILCEGPSVIRKMLTGEIQANKYEIWRLADELKSWKCSRADVGVVTLTFYSAERRVLGHMVNFRITAGKPRYFAVLMPAHNETTDNVIPQLYDLSELIKGQPLSTTLRV